MRTIYDEMISQSDNFRNFKDFVDKNKSNPELSNLLNRADVMLAERKGLYRLRETYLDFGICLDLYTTSSEMRGDNAFTNTYSKYGEIIHKTKYENIPDSSKKELIDSMLESVFDKLKNFNFLYRNIIVVPMPFTQQRTFQPVNYIAHCIATKINRPYNEDILHKNSNVEAKRVHGEYKKGDFTAEYSGKPVSVLIVDDIYGEGTSLRACIKALKDLPEIRNIYYIGITKTRNNGLKS